MGGISGLWDVSEGREKYKERRGYLTARPVTRG